jgi:hypothetical protein
MVIKKWSGTVWQNQAPATTASQIFTDSTFATSIFENNKVKVAYLPNEVFDSLRFGSVVYTDPAADFAEYLQEAYNDSVTIGNRTMVGVYLVAGAVLSIANQATGIQGTASADKYFKWNFINQDSAITGAPTSSGTMEIGDWVVIESITGLGTSGSPFVLSLSIINNTYEIATATTNGIVKLFSSTSNSEAAQSVTNTSGRTYGIQNNASGQMVVNVPWSDTNTTYSAGTGLSLTGTQFANTAPDQVVALTGSGATTITGTYPNFTISSTDTNTTYGIATDTTAGLVELFSNTDQSEAANAVTTTAGRTYGIQLNSANQAVVNVPWVNTVYSLPIATNAVLGGVKLGVGVAAATVQGATTTTGRFYAVGAQNDGTMYVNVPWTDNNTTYTGGSGIGLTGTVFSVGAGIGLTAETDGLKMAQPFVSSADAPAAGYQVLNNLWFDF